MERIMERTVIKKGTLCLSLLLISFIFHTSYLIYHCFIIIIIVNSFRFMSLHACRLMGKKKKGHNCILAVSKRDSQAEQEKQWQVFETTFKQPNTGIPPLPITFPSCVYIFIYHECFFIYHIAIAKSFYSI